MIQWPTITTLILWPFVIGMYYRLARRKEQDALREFGHAYRRYMKQTPIFIPRPKRSAAKDNAGKDAAEKAREPGARP